MPEVSLRFARAALVACCVVSAASSLRAQSAPATADGVAGGPVRALTAHTTPVPTAKVAQAAGVKSKVAPARKTPFTTAAAGTSSKDLPGLAALPASAAGTDRAAASALGPDFVWVPEKASPALRRQVTGGEHVERTTYVRASDRPVSRLSVDRAGPASDIDDRAWPRVWCVPVGEHVSPINGNLLRDGFLGYEDGGNMLGHRFGNEIWNVRDKTVRISCGKDRAARFQLITELQGRKRRIQIRADNLDGPRILPSRACVQVSRLWYVRGAHGREVDGWWDEPLTLIPLLKPLNVPPPDNNVVGQTNQSFHVNIQIPRHVFAGTYRTTLHVTDLDDPLYDEQIQVEVYAQRMR